MPWAKQWLVRLGRVLVVDDARHAPQRSGDERSMEIDSLRTWSKIPTFIQVGQAAGNEPTSTSHAKGHGTDKVKADAVAP